MIYFDYPVYEMHIVCIYGHYPCKEQLSPSILQLVSHFRYPIIKYEIFRTLLEADRDYLEVLNQAQDMLRNKHSIARMTIQIEPYDEHIMSSCENCRRPGT